MRTQKYFEIKKSNACAQKIYMKFAIQRISYKKQKTKYASKNTHLNRGYHFNVNIAQNS